MGVPTYTGEMGCLRIGGMDVPTYRGETDVPTYRGKWGCLRIGGMWMCLRIGGNGGAYV